MYLNPILPSGIEISSVTVSNVSRSIYAFCACGAPASYPLARPNCMPLPGRLAESSSLVLSQERLRS